MRGCGCFDHKRPPQKNNKHQPQGGLMVIYLGKISKTSPYQQIQVGKTHTHTQPHSAVLDPEIKV